MKPGQFLIIRLLLIVSTHGLASATQAPDELPKSDWQGIRAAHFGWKHRFQAIEGGWQARNSGQQWTTRFDGRGFLAIPENAAWTWGLEFQSYGFGESLMEISGIPEVRVEGLRLTYQWSDSVAEWFINDERGLEHGFTIRERPLGGHAGEPLAFILTTSGPLRPVVSADAQAVGFHDKSGALALNYSGLKVWDADGAILPSRFENMTGKNFRLVVEETGARYPLTIDPIAQQAYLKASNTGANDWFGRSVAISEDTVVVGAIFEDSSTTGVNSTPNNSASNSGAVYVFVRSDGVWSQEAYIKASNTGVNDEFGFAVALSGDTLVVGARFEDSSTTGVNSTPDNSLSDSGAAYVFVRSEGVWSEQAYLKPSDSDGDDRFGWAVAVSGDTVVIGVPFEDSSTTGVNSTPDNAASGSGAAYVFVRDGSAWSQQAYLKASNTGATDQFGVSVAISGDTLVAGANFEDSSVSNSGAAYVFVRNGSTWSQEAFLKASNAGNGDEFGSFVAAFGNTVLVSSPKEDSGTSGVNSTPNDSAFNSGAAYVFFRCGITWSQQAYLKASNTGENDLFGSHVALSGDVAVIGAPLEDGGTAGVNGTPDDETLNSGAAYVIVRGGSTWSQQAYLKASNPGEDDNFGGAVGVSGDTVVVGAPFEDSGTSGVNSTPDDAAPNGGAAYTYTGVVGEPISEETAAALLFIQNAGLCGADAELDATPFHDGVGNLLKYAFNMNLAGPDSGTMSPGGVAGLPLITAIPDGASSVFRFEFVRRKNSGLIYQPQKSVDMAGPESWVPLLVSPTVTSIDDDWERAVYEEIYDAQETPASFGRLKVHLP